MAILTEALPLAEPPPELGPGNLDPSLLLASLAALLLAATFATLRTALRQAHGPRILTQCATEAKRKRLEPLLERIEPLATSADILTIASALVFAILLLRATAGDGLAWDQIAATLAIAVPAHLVIVRALPDALARRFGDGLLLHGLGVFRLLQLPLAVFSWAFEALRRAMLRVFGLPHNSRAEREIVQGLRDVIAESEIDGGLDEAEREMIGNVMEFGDVDVAAVMTPRTEIHAVGVSESLREAARAVTESRHSRIPVFEGNLDGILGTLSAQDLVSEMASGELDQRPMREVMRPAFFVPETKRIDELLAEFKRQKIKMAIVLDEYGGTAGMVTMGDILAELVGELQDEHDEDLPSPIRQLPDGAAEVDAGLHVTEVNEEFDLDLPEEEDYETLGGFVLAELGRFPKIGESFRRGDTEFSIVDANDRRVLTVRIETPLSEKSA